MTQDQSARPSEARSFDEWWAARNTCPVCRTSNDYKNAASSAWYISRFEIEQERDQLRARLTEANRRLALAREALDSITKDIQSYSDANFVVQWVLDRNVKAREALAKISAEGQDERG